MVRNISCEETSQLIFSIAGSPPESPSANPPGAGTIGFETEYQVGHYVPPDIFIGVPASLLLRACYPRPCLVLSDISRREPLETADSWEQVSPIIDAGKGMISAMEQTSLADESLRTNGFDSLIE